MATVILPYGYPIQSGAVNSTIIYQGTAARAYTLPADPRTTDQLFNRRLLADTAKVRSHLATIAKGALKTVFGSKWSTVIYQLIKADDAGHWADAVDVWNGFSLGEQTNWREASPYQATFNDPGKVFFCYARTVAQLLYDFSGVYWGAQVWGMGQSDDALNWWSDLVSWWIPNGGWDSGDGYLTFIGSWQSNGFAGANQGDVQETLTNGAGSCELYFYGKELHLHYIKFSYYGTCEVWLDGVSQGVIDQHNATLVVDQIFDVWPAVKGTHFVRMVAVTNRFNLDWMTSV